MPRVDTPIQYEQEVGTHAHKRKSSVALRRYNTDPAPSAARPSEVDAQHDESDSDQDDLDIGISFGR